MAHLHKRVLSIVLSSCLGLCASCSDEEEVDYDSQESLVWVTQQTFGDVDPQAQVAVVDGTPITVVELALCLHAAPMLTAEACLNDRIDTLLVRPHVTDEDRQADSVRDAYTDAMAVTLLRDAIDRPYHNSTIEPEEVEAFMADPDNRLFLETPELRQYSHLLVRGPEGASTTAHALCERMLNEGDWSQVRSIADFYPIVDQFAQIIDEASHQTLIETSGWSGPHATDPPMWPALPAVVPEFEQALYGLAEPGDLSGCVDTSYGTHIIILEQIWEQEDLGADETRQIAVMELGGRRRSEVLADFMEELLAEQPLIEFSENIDILRQDVEEMLQQHGSELRENIAPQ